MAPVVVRSPFRPADLQRQRRRGAIQGLNLALLVHTEHERPIRWIQVQPHDVTDLIDEEWILRQLERLDPMRL